MMCSCCNNVVLLILFGVISSCRTTIAYTPSRGSNGHHHRQKITRDSLVGVWKLTRARSKLVVVVVPSSEQQQQQQEKEDDILLKLKDDGTFEPASSSTTTRNAIKNRKSFLGLGSNVLEGRWEYVQGNLVLASNRPKTMDDLRKVRDTMLEGKVLYDKNDDNNNNKRRSSLLSIPDGCIQMGKFVYPPNHRSFFDTPMFFEPTLVGNFVLEQVVSEQSIVGAISNNDDDDNLVEKFQRNDFADKYFWLSSYPLPNKSSSKKKESLLTKSRRARGKLQQQQQQQQSPTSSRTPSLADIRVLKVHFFRNYTFEITDGVGSMLQLRGMWDIVGEERDQLWMQITRFGSGRSVSGSTYSEGATLSHDDQKMYRGTIYRGNDNNNNNNKEGGGVGDTDSCTNYAADPSPGEKTTGSKTQIQVKGEVYLGKVSTFREALFVMREASDSPTSADDDENDDEEDEVIADDNAFQ